eukprot:SAG25_NODE_145_length_13941_cov_48.705967_5_plen_57_part_00
MRQKLLLLLLLATLHCPSTLTLRAECQHYGAYVTLQCSARGAADGYDVAALQEEKE